MATNQVVKAEAKSIEPVDQNKVAGTKLVSAQMRKTEMFSGPFPHPDHLERYGQIVHDGAERIFHMVESQVDHRINSETRLIAADIRRSDHGLWCGFILALMVTSGGFWIAMHDKSIGGYATMLAPLATIAGLFIYNRQTQMAMKEQVEPPKKKKK